MPKIIKISSIVILAFFIFETSPPRTIYAQDIVTLENGFRVIIKEDHRNPLVTFSVFIDMGSSSEGKFLGSGASHLVEHMLFKGTKKYPNRKIENILHIYGGQIEGFTSYDYTGFRITILNEHKDVALDILKEMIVSPLFTEKDLEKEKEVIEREMDLEDDDPARKASRLIFSNAYIRHPYRVPIIGYKENFKRLDRNGLIEFFNSNYTADHIVMAVVGDIDREAMLNDIRNIFGEIKKGDNIYNALPEEPVQIAERRIEDNKDIEGAYLNIGFHSTALLNKDLYAMDLLSFILGQGDSSRLNERVRIKEQLALSISAYNYTPKDPGLFIISSVLKEENLNKAIDEIMREVGAIKESGVSEEELVKAKNNFIAQYMFQKETIESQANDLALGTILAGDALFFEKYIENIKTVSLEDVQRVAKKYLTADNMTIVALTKSGNALKKEKASSLQRRQREIKKVLLENKLPLLVCEDLQLPTLSISLLFKGGLRLETKEDNGISKLTSLMFMDGTSSMTREEIAKFYESKGMSVKTFSGNNSLGISVNCLKENIEDGIRLASELCINPVFPEEELEREKKELGFAIDIEDNQIFDQGHRLLKEQLFKVHPYGLQLIGTHQSIDNIKREDLLRFHRAILSADNMALGIAGDCNTDKALELAKKYFASVPTIKQELVFPEKEPLIEKARTLHLNVGKNQSLVLLGFHGIDIYSGEKYAVEVMMEILSTESGILFEKIREERGLSYAAGAFHILGIDPGYLAIYALTSKENIGKVKDIITREISYFVKTNVTDEVIKKAKNHLKAMRQMEMQTNLNFIFTTSMDELYGLGYDNYKNYNKNIDSITKEDIKRVASKFLTLDKCAIVILEGT
jgi:zinc protease